MAAQLEDNPVYAHAMGAYQAIITVSGKILEMTRQQLRRNLSGEDLQVSKLFADAESSIDGGNFSDVNIHDLDKYISSAGLEIDCSRTKSVIYTILPVLL